MKNKKKNIVDEEVIKRINRISHRLNKLEEPIDKYTLIPNLQLKRIKSELKEIKDILFQS